MPDVPVRMALVTGANCGIGFEVRRQLAERGFVILLTARRRRKGHVTAKNLDNADFTFDVVPKSRSGNLECTEIDLPEFCSLNDYKPVPEDTGRLLVTYRISVSALAIMHSRDPPIQMAEKPPSTAKSTPFT